MYATVRRYEGIDELRSDEIARKIDRSLAPAISELPGFVGYFVIDAGAGRIASVGLFARSAEAHASTRLEASWIRDHHLLGALPNSPTITAGPVIVDTTQSDSLPIGVLTPA